MPRAYVIAGATLIGVLSFAACASCRKAPGGPSPSASTQASAPERSRSTAPPDAGPVLARDVASWTHAREGSEEDLAALAVHEGAAGLVEAAAEPDLRLTAIRAMAYAHGWAQVPFLAASVDSKDDDEARSALDALAQLAARPRRSEDAEDAAELAEGCEKLAVIAKDAARARARRIGAIRALRMMPCPPSELPTDLDAR